MFKVPSTVLNISYLLFQQKLTLKNSEISTLTTHITNEGTGAWKKAKKLA